MPSEGKGHEASPGVWLVVGLRKGSPRVGRQLEVQLMKLKG